MADRLPWLPFDVGEYLAGTAHLSTEEHGAYLLLQLHYWIHGRLPSDDRSLAQISRNSPKKWKGMRETISPFFNGDWSGHPRLDADLLKARQISMKRRINGAKGGFRSAVTRRQDELFDRANQPAIASPITSPIAQANGAAKKKLPDTQSQSPIETTTEQEAARDGLPKRTDRVSREELEASFEARRIASS